MKKIAMIMSMVFCFAMFANAQRPWSSTSEPGRVKASSKMYKPGKSCKRGQFKHFKRFDRGGQKGGVYKNNNFNRNFSR
ncbi:MAG: hypothetical protein FWF35_00540 [Elusimicrobia bacterium]|nr:hypothetical protein [Elusimicrobiota bacterium]